MQGFIVAILFVGALAYLAFTFFKSTKGEAGCSSNCGCEVKKGSVLKVHRPE